MNEEEKEKYLAYKLLEWAGSCDDMPSFENLPQSQIRNATDEAKSILKRLNNYSIDK